MDSRKILQKVVNDYNKISKHFNITRKRDWEEFEFFKKYILDFYKKNKEKTLNILDIGCGNGRLIKFLNSLDIKYKYLGIDNSEGQINQARKNFPNSKFEIESILNLKQYENKFDLVFCIATFHHLPGEKLKLKGLDEIKNSLRNNGFVFMTNWNLFQKKYFKYLFINKDFFKYGIQHTFIPWKNEKGENISNRYYYAFLRSELKDLFIKAGFSIIENTYSQNQNIFRAKNIISILEKN